jgi:hypothetical protein
MKNILEPCAHCSIAYIHQTPTIATLGTLIVKIDNNKKIIVINIKNIIINIKL